MPADATSPEHYSYAEVEPIEYIRGLQTVDEFRAYCQGNVIKYISRWKRKGGVEDLRKAEVYLRWMIEGRPERVSRPSLEPLRSGCNNSNNNNKEGSHD